MVFFVCDGSITSATSTEAMTTLAASEPIKKVWVDWEDPATKGCDDPTKYDWVDYDESKDTDEEPLTYSYLEDRTKDKKLKTGCMQYSEDKIFLPKEYKTFFDARAEYEAAEKDWEAVKQYSCLTQPGFGLKSREEQYKEMIDMNAKKKAKEEAKEAAWAEWKEAAKALKEAEEKPGVKDACVRRREQIRAKNVEDHERSTWMKNDERDMFLPTEYRAKRQAYAEYYKAAEEKENAAKARLYAVEKDAEETADTAVEEAEKNFKEADEAANATRDALGVAEKEVYEDQTLRELILKWRAEKLTGEKLTEAEEEILVGYADRAEEAAKERAANSSN